MQPAGSSSRDWGCCLTVPASDPKRRLAISGALRLIRQPLRVAGVAMLSWLVALAAFAVAIACLVLTWDATRQGLVMLGRPHDPAGLVGALITVGLLTGVWLVALSLCGLASAFRSTLWTMDTLR